MKRLFYGYALCLLKEIKLVLLMKEIKLVLLMSFSQFLNDH